ncbi:MAG: sulfite exporter TauE/SafE family protein [Oscillospiraceae bacterium]|nr:sulfite exporter TauE/SafE family protein [Oscillospiraceae bacterium]
MSATKTTKTTEHLLIGGMTCASCQRRIESSLLDTDGVLAATASWANGCADVTYDAEVASPRAVRAAIERHGYEVLRNSRATAETDGTRALGLLLVIAALYLVASRLNLAKAFPLAEAGMGYGMLFVIGLLTSAHCVAMCGGINLSQCVGNPVRASLLYNVGRVASYTLVGGIVGALGGVITLSGAFRGVVQLVAGIFMVIAGVNMLGIFPSLRKLQPRLPRALSVRINRVKSNSPLLVGLLNGLMPCGPLQAMQLYALGTGSPINGALSMLVFSLGTAPLMFGLGALSSLLSKRFTRKVMTAGAVLVAVLGLTMLTQGMSLSGLSLSGTGSASTASDAIVVEGVQLVSSTLSSGEYPKITVQAGLPVRWTIDAPKGSINGCNNRVLIPEYDIEHKFQTGENVIEFTPTETGQFRYSCWMGMIRSTITVIDAAQISVGG